MRPFQEEILVKLGSKRINLIMVFLLVLQLGVIVPDVSARDTTIEITKYSVSQETISAEDQFNLDMEVKNNSDLKITGLYLKVEKLSGFSLKDMDSKRLVSASLDPGASASVSINMVYHGGGDGQIPVIFSYTKAGHSEQITEERYLLANVKDSTDDQAVGEDRPILAIQNKETLYTSAGSKFSTDIKVQNISNDSVGEVLIKASFNEDAPLSFPGEQLFYFRSLDSNETKTIYLNVLAGEKAENGTYIMKIDYQFITSGESYEAYENMYVQVAGAKAPPSLVLAPQIDEESYLVPGEDFKLLISARNQGQLKARDIVITLEGLSDNGISLSSGSNRQYIDDDLGVGTEREITYLIKAAPGMEHDSYPLIIKASYTDQTGAVYTTEQELLLRVRTQLITEDQESDDSSSQETVGNKMPQISRLEVGNIRFSGDMTVGKLVMLHCTYYNTGQVKLSNLIIKIDGDFEITDETSFIGDMEEGSSGYYYGVIKPLKPGAISGELIFSCQDLSGEPLVLVEPFTMDIAGEIATANVDDTRQSKEGFRLWHIIIPILIAGAATAGLQIQRRNHLDEEMPPDE